MKFLVSILLFALLNISYSYQDTTHVNLNHINQEKQNQINVGRQFGYGILYGHGIGAATGMFVGMLTIPKCDGWGCLGALVVTFGATELGLAIGTPIGVTIGSNGNLSGTGKFLAFLGSAGGVATSIAVMNNTNNIPLFLASNLILPSLFSTLFSQGGIKTQQEQALFNLYNQSISFPNFKIGTNTIQVSDKNIIKYCIEIPIIGF